MQTSVELTSGELTVIRELVRMANFNVPENSDKESKEFLERYRNMFLCHCKNIDLKCSIAIGGCDTPDLIEYFKEQAEKRFNDKLNGKDNG